MACCGKRKVWTAHAPFIIGDPTGPPIEVVPTVHVLGFAPGVPVWMKGSGVQALIDQGWIERVSS